MAAESTGVSPSRSASMGLTEEQVAVIVSLERLGGSLSLIGVTLVLVTYSAFKRLRTVPNTFIFFASIANVGASIACLIGRDGLTMGPGSPLCRAQAFLFEVFMQSDPWWSLAMAVNVFIVFFMSANPNNFRRYKWIYCAVCFGAPAIAGFALLFLQSDPSRGPIYGDATLWCWIGKEWSHLRIYAYYLPIWMCIILSALIYLAVGYHVFHQRNKLRNLTLSNQAKDSSNSEIGRLEKNASDPGPVSFYGTATTEVHVISERPEIQVPSPTPGGAGARSSHDDDWPVNGDEEAGPRGASTAANPYHTVSSISTAAKPSNPQASPKKSQSRILRPWRRFLTRLKNVDPVKQAYLRTSAIFAFSVLVTWTPSSINRVYNVVHPEDTNYGLNIASATVLPLQGVWNAVIYFAMSWKAVKEELAVLVRNLFPCWRRAAAAAGPKHMVVQTKQNAQAAAIGGGVGPEAAASVGGAGSRGPMTGAGGRDPGSAAGRESNGCQQFARHGSVGSGDSSEIELTRNVGGLANVRVFRGCAL